LGGTSDTRLVDESGSPLKSVIVHKGVESVESLKENGSVGDSHVKSDMVGIVSIKSGEEDSGVVSHFFFSLVGSG
jgi:hypothetical protein